MYGYDDAVKYLNGYKPKITNQRPIVTERGVNGQAPSDQYFKGALFLNTLRSAMNDDKRWWALIHGFYQRFKYQTILTEDVVRYFNQKSGMDLTPVFDQYLRHTALPTLELKFDEASGVVRYRWKTDEPAFRMPVQVGTKGHWQIIRPTADWKVLKTPLGKDDFSVPTDRYYINVSKS
jgi:aminopeptidase N